MKSPPPTAGDVYWIAEACLICVATRPQKDIVLRCVEYGFNLYRKSGRGVKPPVWSDVIPRNPQCKDVGSATFVNTLTNDPDIDYDLGDEFVRGLYIYTADELGVYD